MIDLKDMDYNKDYILEMDTDIPLTGKVTKVVVHVDSMEKYVKRYHAAIPGQDRQACDIAVRFNMTAKVGRKKRKITFQFWSSDYWEGNWGRTLGLDLWGGVAQALSDRTDPKHGVQATLDVRLTRYDNPYITKITDVKEIP